MSLKLQKDNIITTPGGPFKKSQQQEIDGLIARGVFKFIQYDPNKYLGI